MAYVKTGLTINYTCDEEKSLEENKKSIIEAVTKMIDSIETEDFLVTVQVPVMDIMDSDEVEQLINEAESMGDLINSLDMTPVAIDKDGDPIFGMKKGEK